MIYDLRGGEANVARTSWRQSVHEHVTTGLSPYDPRGWYIHLHLKLIFMVNMVHIPNMDPMGSMGLVQFTYIYYI